MKQYSVLQSVPAWRASHSIAAAAKLKNTLCDQGRDLLSNLQAAVSECQQE